MLKLVMIFAVYVLIIRQIAYKLPYKIAVEEMQKNRAYHDWIELVFFFMALLLGFLFDLLLFGPAAKSAQKAGIVGLPYLAYKAMSVGCYVVPMAFGGWCGILMSQNITPNCKE